MENNFPDACRQIVKSADNALAHTFDLLGSSPIFLGRDINWHLDFKSGVRWPIRPYHQIRIVNFDDTSDIKVPWELSRLQFLVDLGRAFLLTGNQAYKKEFEAILGDWEKSNPVDKGINWACSMEAAIRAINIIWGIYLFGNEISPQRLCRAIKLLYYHALHIEQNLEIVSAGANSNHLIANYQGLFFIGTLFPEFDRSARWRKLSLDGLEAQIREQVLPDGVDYECSTSYHRLVLEMFLSAFILGRINSQSFSEIFRERLHRMIHFSAALTAPSGLVPLIGDNDDGFIVKLSTDNPADHRPLIDIGLLMFGERIPLAVPISQERLWYFGKESLVAFKTARNSRSRLFKESGYGVISGDDFHLVFNAAAIPGQSFGGHKHNDLLSFTLEIGGESYLIDPGTFCYSADYRQRNASRSVNNHNTVAIDGAEQNRFWEKRLFYLVNDAKTNINLWASFDNCAVISASQTGYGRLDDKIAHKRTVWVSLVSGSLHVLDEFSGRAGSLHTFDHSFITPVTAVTSSGRSTAVLRGSQNKRLIIKALENDLLEFIIEPANYSPRYGIRLPATKIIYRYQARLPFKIFTMMAPCSKQSYGSAGLEDEDRLRLAAYDIKKTFEAVGLGV